MKYSIIDRKIILAPDYITNNKEIGDLSQQQSITGKVTDSQTGEAMPGVNVIVKGTTIGVITDSGGKYSITISDQNAVLVFSFIGFSTMEVPVESKSVVNVALVSESLTLEEVVVIGYGTVRKSDLTGSVAVVKDIQFKERASTSFSQALQGRLAGVNTTVNSGRPGGRSIIRIRGNTSISVSNDPLYVVDGVILNVANLANGSTAIDYIDPQNISSIEVLKDASATAIYGARGSNGVILVTTKGGSQEGNMLNYDTYVSVGKLPRKLELLNAKEFLQVEDILYQNAKKYDPNGWAAGKYVDPKLKRTNPLLFDKNGEPLYDTDWQEEATQTSITQNHYLSFTGGNRDGNYGIFLGYRNEEGIMKESWLKRYSSRFVAENRINEWLTAGGSLSYNVQNEKQQDPVNAGGITPMRQVWQALPILPVKYPSGKWGSNEDYPGMEGGTTYSNLVAERIYLPNTQTMLGNLFINIKLLKGLNFKTSIGTHVINQREDYYAGGDLKYVSRDQKGVAYVVNQRNNSFQFENQLIYNTNFSGIHSVSAVVGTSLQRVDQFTNRAETWGFLDDYFQFNNLGMGSNPRPSSSGKSSYSLASYFGRINYTLMNKYLLTATSRFDGSSKFGSENKYAFFPSLALGWKISEESFLQDNPIISNLKLRASYGLTGNSEIPNYQSIGGLGNYNGLFYGKRIVGVGISRVANPELRWEKNTQIDMGLEIGLLENKLSFEADFYFRSSVDMLMSAPLPTSSGYGSVFKNVGSMVNKGFELSLNTNNITRTDFTWSTSFNISVNKDKVLKLTGGADIISGSNVDGQTIIREGEAINSFFGLVSLGTWQTGEEEQAKVYFCLPGDRKFKDMNNDGSINNSDRVIIGCGSPDGYGSLINNFRYKEFELIMDIQFMYGNDVSFMSKSTTEDRQGITNVFRTVLNAWRPDNQNTSIAELRPTMARYERYASSTRIYDGSFIRGRNLSLSYSFSPELVSKLKLRNLRAYASAQNLFLITKYPGYDPEVSTSTSQFAQGMDFYSYPKPRVFTVGLNITL